MDESFLEWANIANQYGIFLEGIKLLLSKWDIPRRDKYC